MTHLLLLCGRGDRKSPQLGPGTAAHACMMLHCWMAVCCSRLASSCRCRAAWQSGKLVTTSSGIRRALWQICTAWTFGLSDSISDNKCWKCEFTFYIVESMGEKMCILIAYFISSINSLFHKSLLLNNRSVTCYKYFSRNFSLMYSVLRL